MKKPHKILQLHVYGVQNNSANHTVELAVSVTATPAAVIPNNAMRTVGSVWNCKICSCLDLGDVEPSILMNLHCPLMKLLKPAVIKKQFRLEEQILGE